jgi:hypothetical protein
MGTLGLVLDVYVCGVYFRRYVRCVFLLYFVDFVAGGCKHLVIAEVAHHSPFRPGGRRGFLRFGGC